MSTYNPGQNKVSLKNRYLYYYMLRNIQIFFQVRLWAPLPSARVRCCRGPVRLKCHQYSRGGSTLNRGEGLLVRNYVVRDWTHIIFSPKPTTNLTSIVETVASCSRGQSRRLNTYFHAALKHPRNAHGGLAGQSSPALSPGPSSGD